MNDDNSPPLSFLQRVYVRNFLRAAGGLCGGVIVALLLYLIGAGLTPLPQEFVSMTSVFGLPVFMGAATLCLSTPEQQQSLRHRVLAPWGTLLLLYTILTLISWETVICLIMLTPVALIGASAGGLLAGWLLTHWRRRRARRATLASFIFLPMLLGTIEPMLLPTRTEFVTVVDRITIAASPEQVWRTLVHVPDIRDDELQSSFSHAIGLPRPRAALMTGEGVGATRDLRWEDGVQFRETVTDWQPGRLLAYDVDVSPASEALKRLDPHVVIGDRYFDVLRGHYALAPAPGGATELTLSTTYRISTRINGYGKLWADNTLHDFHSVVLALLRDRVGAGATPGQLASAR